MNIKTRSFGDISISEDDIIIFTEGMYGFEEYKKYIILKDTPEDDIMYLQSVDNKDLSFVLIDPFVVINNYEPNVEIDDLEKLDVQEKSQLRFLLVAIISKEIENSVVNLKSPIAINTDLNIAKQIILENLEYPLRYPMFNNKGDGRC
ncbi:flagellar assembly factor FliW [Sedimentibacter acidaminivorans]|uniref:Flagellar assembly factor FliW n=1 Tax=Sedimentibacter acidaminivorans TaxID=913099 RepID=A0ABS4GDH9_9FIRM|nr:flagellar assembly protein FliW [Sedimentibacter acidaminivorans]MBP1925760.1 flagellar assembly factor FliW [Sedimentibacter acidaminivorans]